MTTEPVAPLPPEPDDGTALYWPEDAETYARLIIRDDAAALATLSSHSELPVGASWFGPNIDDVPMTWAEVVSAVFDDDTQLSAAVVLRPIPKEG